MLKRFCKLSLWVSNCITLASNCAASFKSSLLLLVNAFSVCLASNLSLATSTSFAASSSLTRPASSKNLILSCAVNLSLLTAFSLSSAIFLSASDRSTIKSLAFFSAFALWSAIFAAASPSDLISLPNFLTESMALSTLSVTLSTPKTTLPILSVAILPASLKLPLNSCSTALPKFGIKFNNP